MGWTIWPCWKRFSWSPALTLMVLDVILLTQTACVLKKVYQPATEREMPTPSQSSSCVCVGGWLILDSHLLPTWMRLSEEQLKLHQWFICFFPICKLKVVQRREGMDLIYCMNSLSKHFMNIGGHCYGGLVIAAWQTCFVWHCMMAVSMKHMGSTVHKDVWLHPWAHSNFSTCN